MMSWFTDLAGKAEQLLNKVDQTAATAFSKEEITNTSSSLKSFVPYYQHSSEVQQHTPVSVSYQTPLVGSPTSLPSTKPKSKQEIEDEKLFNFLNAEDRPVASKQDKIKNVPQSSVTSVSSGSKLSGKDLSSDTVPESQTTTTSNENKHTSGIIFFWYLLLYIKY